MTHLKWMGSPSVWAQPNEGERQGGGTTRGSDAVSRAKKEKEKKGRILETESVPFFTPCGNKKQHIPGRATASTESGVH